jgi:hypothetical protein
MKMKVAVNNNASVIYNRQCTNMAAFTFHMASGTVIWPSHCQKIQQCMAIEEVQ